ncbi:hypothetical protein, partial [Armatimonas sp.]|uniref:hypothetical protein n=1 Tax=Armatimonas sp. TaxID=1872638 RepID=UPI00286D2C49
LFLRALLKDANEARRRFLCDTDLIPVFPQGDPQHDRYLRAREKKQAAYGRTNPEKTGVAAPRGFLQLPLEGNYPDLPPVRDRDEKATPEMVERDWAYDDSTLLREELQEVRQTRQELEQSGDTRFSVRLWLDSLAAQESRLMRRLRAIEFLEVAGTDQDGEILWEGAAAANQRMDFGVLAELLRNIQTIVKRLTPSQSFTLQAGVPQPGSFRIPFYLVPEAEAETGQATLLEIAPENPADLFAQMLDDDATHDQISSHLTNDTVRRSYVQVMKHVAANGLVMEFRTRHLPGGGVLTPKHATERQVWFDDSHTKVENIVLTGELQTGTIVAGSCKILSSNGEKPYTLRIDKARALQLRGIPLAALVRASVERITTTHPDFDRPRIVHRLTHIERLDTPGLFG